MNTSRRSFIGAGAASVTLNLGASAFAQPRVIRLGDTAALPMAWPIYIADKKGFFAENGLKIEITYTNANPAAAQQTVAGNFDMAVTTYETGIRAIVNDAPLKIVGSLMRAFPYTIMSQQNVRSLTDLKGKKVLLTLAKSVLTVFWNRWVAEKGFKVEDFDQVYDPATPNRFAALQAGAVGAAVLSQPFDWIAADRGANLLFDLGAYAKGFGFTSFVARADWLQKNPDVMKSFLRAVSKGVTWFYDPANKAEAAKILVSETKMEEANALRTWDYYTKELKPFDASLDLPDRQIDLLIGVLVEMGDFKAGGDYRPARFVDASFLPK